MLWSVQAVTLRSIKSDFAIFLGGGESMKEVVIISAVRTPVGRYMGALKNIEAYDLAAKF